MPSTSHAHDLSGITLPNRGPEPAPEPKKLILCFDGTGNEFSGSNADTNVVKILNKLDRHDPHQFHYYQTGIGTYEVNEQSVNKTSLGEMRSSIFKTVDQGVGLSFDAHVMAGYKFLMRYYDTGDKIYLFGFSRGAFTAKFLARMVNTVGLLCKGNTEMVPFAFRLYQRYLAGEMKEIAEASGNKCAEKGADYPKDTQREHHSHGYNLAHDEITAFSSTFCRKEQTRHGSKVFERDIKAYFLGMWDCVNSVSVLERQTPVPIPVKGTAHFVRHAVAVDERRVKFKPALLAQDLRSSSHENEDIKEVWFPGCHGDVGGGWPADEANPLDIKKNEDLTVRQRTKKFWVTRNPKEPSKDETMDRFQMSDVALSWMIRELETIGELDPSAAVKWLNDVNDFNSRFTQRLEQARNGLMHDPLKFGSGIGFPTVVLWKFIEWLPFVTRWELEENAWVNVRFPLNRGAARDIPRDAVLHESVLRRLLDDPTYHPQNNHGGRSPPCLKQKDHIVKVHPVAGDHGEPHRTYKLARANDQGG